MVLRLESGPELNDGVHLEHAERFLERAKRVETERQHRHPDPHLYDGAVEDLDGDVEDGRDVGNGESEAVAQGDVDKVLVADVNAIEAVVVASEKCGPVT